MTSRLLRGSPVFICVLILFCVGCSAESKMYSRIIIDTYNPADGSSPAGNSNYIELWSSDGTKLLASDNGLVNEKFRTPNQYYAYIDYTGGLDSGDYWVLIRAAVPGDTFDYGIRVLTAPDSSYAGWTFIGASSDTVTDLPLVGGSGIPSSYQTMVLNKPGSNRLHRDIVFIATNDAVNWVKLTLP